jgi:hypothetical protein
VTDTDEAAKAAAWPAAMARLQKINNFLHIQLGQGCNFFTTDALHPNGVPKLRAIVKRCFKGLF